MPALYTITTRASGTILTAAIYNADHQNHVNNGDAAHLGAFSASSSQMRTQTSPGDVGSESLALSIADELARIRYMIALQRGTTFWYGTARAATDGINYFRNSDVLTFSRQGQAAKTYAATAGDIYTADQFYVHNGANQAMLVFPGAILSTRSVQSLGVQRTAGQTGITQMWVGQPFTLPVITALRGQTVTVACNYFGNANFSSANVSLLLSTGTGAVASKITGFTGRVDQTVYTGATVLGVGTRISGTALIPVNATQMDVIVIWTPVGTAGVNDSILLGEFDLKVGNTLTPYVNPDPYQELDELQVYYCKSFDLGVAPAQNAGVSGALIFPPQTVAAATAAGNVNFRFPVRMIKAPTCTIYNPSAANALARNTTVAADCGATAINSTSEQGINISYTSAAGSAATNLNAIHMQAEAGI